MSRSTREDTIAGGRPGQLLTSDLLFRPTPRPDDELLTASSGSCQSPFAPIWIWPRISPPGLALVQLVQMFM